VLFWLVDNAQILYLFIGMVAFALAAAWWMTRQRVYLIGLAATVGLFLAIWLLGRLIITDREQIRRNVFAMRDAVIDGKPDDLVKHIAREFEFQGMDRQRFIDYAKQFLPRKRVQDIHIFNYDTEELSGAEGKARVAFRVRASTDFGEGMYMVRLDFVREGEHWRLRRCRFFNPIVNQDQPIQVPLP
jgi:hypothetical protein